jgi:lipopolysaccharide transport system ATP-binding protein
VRGAAIRVEGLGKRYRIGAWKGKHDTLRDRLADAFSRSFLNLGRRTGCDVTDEQESVIWALKDVTFEVAPGEVLGVIGRNGAGKSTLLKILSRITEPTEGYAEITGRVGSLLEVGTGFHGELTGRENIFLNGAILGMTKVEIERKFDEVVAFAEVERFLDTPVKHYSTGMHMRLAFAVAAHLDPEILLVDEVLAVGDAAFQRKCIGKMGEVARAGRTVLFISHNMAAITTFCHRSLLLDNGRVLMRGSAAEVTACYQARALAITSDGSDLRAADRRGSGKALFSSISIRPWSPSGEPPAAPVTGCGLAIETTITGVSGIAAADVGVVIYDANGYRLIDLHTALKGEFLSLGAGQRATVRFLMREMLLRPGTYFAGLWLGRGGIEEIDSVEYAMKFSVINNPDLAKHVESFPGPYQCKFDGTINYHT